VRGVELQRHAGIGLRQPHYAQLLDASAPPITPPIAPLAFVEVHSENFFGAGGAALQVLHQARERWPVSLHGVGLSLGSAVGIDETHLSQLEQLVARIDPVRVSDHASFARACLRTGVEGVEGVEGLEAVHANDLLPIAFTDEALHIMVANVQHVQERLKRPLLVENLSAYLHWADSSLAEPEFFNQLTQRSGCGLLLDVNNLVVNALNQRPGDTAAAVANACAWVDSITANSVGEIHLAGYHDSGSIVIDDHGSRVHAPVWQVFQHTLRRLGVRPTLVEWDSALPPLSDLLEEAAAAELLLQAHA
jgi:uncharacterized protein